ncbi:Flagellar hook-associated protein flgK [Hyphomicrobiales bacterium]|nr:Flagellar hook-associated protein flgK [Hyphomicrobiales bacterium]CAH1673374.1 Flagellar hook-associated protein flgK [Hyphomicrobiales bacterium]
MRDLIHNIAALPAIAPAVQSAAVDGAAMDLKGFNRVAFVINTGAIAGSGDFGVKVQESDDGSAFTDAAASAVLGAVPATLAATTAYKLGYVGFKQYARLSLTKAGGTSIALSALAILGDPASAPVT